MTIDDYRKWIKSGKALEDYEFLLQRNNEQRNTIQLQQEAIDKQEIKINKQEAKMTKQKDVCDMLTDYVIDLQYQLDINTL